MRRNEATRNEVALNGTEPANCSSPARGSEAFPAPYAGPPGMNAVGNRCVLGQVQTMDKG